MVAVSGNARSGVFGFWVLVTLKQSDCRGTGINFGSTCSSMAMTILHSHHFPLSGRLADGCRSTMVVMVALR
jgi:hypothetical protein